MRYDIILRMNAKLKVRGLKRRGALPPPCVLLCAVLAFAQTALAAPKPLAASVTDTFKEILPLAFHALPEKMSQKTVWPLLGRDKLSYQRAFPVRPFVDELIMTGVSADGKRIKAAFPCKAAPGGFTNCWFKANDVLGLRAPLVWRDAPEEWTASNGVQCLVYRLNGSQRPVLLGRLRDGLDGWAMGELKFQDETFRLICCGDNAHMVFGKGVRGRLVLVKEHAPFSSDQYFTRMNELLGEAPFQVGLHWDNSTHPFLIPESGNGGCAALVTDFACYLFGVRNFDAGERFENPAEIRTGDVIALKGHYMAVLWREGEILHTIEGNFNSSIHRSSQAYSVRGGQLCGGKPFLNGWHYIDREIYAGGNPERTKGRKKSR